ncbi:unnamed protein product [Meloidogyne enterolobii]|uniref:Uncharacterized protein n=2 Tax=Meloidogyne enterolobii TaxID=390850 RepID=A0ACB0XN19_MELEN
MSSCCPSFSSWIRCLTVFAYFILVSSPAFLFSFYYTQIWDPTYINEKIYTRFDNGTLVLKQGIIGTFGWTGQRNGSNVRKGISWSF